MRLSTLNSVGALSLKEQPVVHSLSFIYEMLRELLSIQTMILEIHHPKHHDLIKRIVKGVEANRDQPMLTPECQEWVEKTYNAQDSVIVSNLKQALISEGRKKTRIRASLFVPLHTHDKRIGVLHLHSLPNPIPSMKKPLNCSTPSQTNWR